MKTVYNNGVNDTYYGWRTENKYNELIYRKWADMLQRVYSEKYHEKQPTYINSTLCLEWHWLSKFAKDFVKIDGYNYDKFMNGELVLDKDIKSNGKNKEYSLENCMLVSKLENTRQANKTREYVVGENNPIYGVNKTEEHKIKISELAKERYKNKENHPMSKKVAQYDLDGNLIKIWNCAKEISDVYNWNYTTFITHVNGRYSHKYKSFIWKYYKDSDVRIIKNKYK